MSIDDSDAAGSGAPAGGRPDRLDTNLEAVNEEHRPLIRRWITESGLAGEEGGASGEAERARVELLGLIMEINKRCWMAVWKYDIEFDLWEMALEGGARDYGLDRVTERELGELRDLAESAGGWFTDLCEEAGGEQRLTFIPLPDWRERWGEIATEVRARR